MVDDPRHLDDQSLVLSPVPEGDVSEAQPHPELPWRGDGGGAVSSGDHVTGGHKASPANLKSKGGLSSETTFNQLCFARIAANYSKPNHVLPVPALLPNDYCEHLS